MIAKIKLLDAEVVQVGEHWSEADRHLRDVLLKADANGVYVPPFDHVDIVSFYFFSLLLQVRSWFMYFCVHVCVSWGLLLRFSNLHYSPIISISKENSVNQVYYTL